MTQAVGFAWAAKQKKDDVVVSVYFGEGATSSNEFHTAMNFAGVFQTPTVFLCRNNHWAISVPSDKQTASESFAAKGIAYGIPGVRVDGNDPLAVWKVVREAVDRAASGGGPTLVEMLTYRLGGHSTSDDPRVYRNQDEVDHWTQEDPIERTRRFLEARSLWSDEQEESFRQGVERDLKRCIEHAEGVGKPALETLFEEVFAETPQHLEEQKQECLEGPRAPDLH